MSSDSPVSPEDERPAPAEALSVETAPPPASPGATPPGVTIELPPALAALLRNPVVLAGGALVTGLVLSRLFGTPAGRRMARDLAEEAFKRAGPAAGTLAASSLLEAGMEKLRPHLTEYAKKMLAEVLRKKE